MSSKTKHFTLDERFQFGNFTLPEVAELKKCSERKVQYDIANGLLPIERHGRSVRIAGPIARQYLAGERAT